MKITAHHHCYNHRLRQAVARCPECGNFCCRECITEHLDRMLCSACLKKAVGSGGKDKGRTYGLVLLFLQSLGGWLVLCYTFYVIGKLLLAIPHDFHEGTLWKENWWGS
jgi:hypothetical protein